jgi:hypothetical protein
MGVGRFCSSIEVMVMVDVFLFIFLQLAHIREWRKQNHTKGGITMIANITHQRKHANNMTKRRVDKYYSPSEAMVLAR